MTVNLKIMIENLAQGAFILVRLFLKSESRKTLMIDVRMIDL